MVIDQPSVVGRTFKNDSLVDQLDGSLKIFPADVFLPAWKIYVDGCVGNSGDNKSFPTFGFAIGIVFVPSSQSFPVQSSHGNIIYISPLQFKCIKRTSPWLVSKIPFRYQEHEFGKPEENGSFRVPQMPRGISVVRTEDQDAEMRSLRISARKDKESEVENESERVEF